MLKKLIHHLSNPKRIYRGLTYRLINLFANRLSDKKYLEYRWLITFGKRLNLSDPRSFNEKLQWLKLNNRQPIYTKLVDKYEVKDYVANIIGKDHIIPTLGVYDRAEDIDFDALPNQYVLKCTHDSGGIVICKDKTLLNRESAIRKLNKGLHSNFYMSSREWPYKNVKPRIIAEQYIPEEEGDLKDYKFFCFDGIPKIMYIASDRFSKNEETKFDFYDMDFNHLPIQNGHPNANNPINKPKGFELMKMMATNLSSGFPHVRVDFYDVNGHIFFGEMTFYHMSGFVKFEPEEWDYKIGEYIKLPNEKSN